MPRRLITPLIVCLLGILLAGTVYAGVHPLIDMQGFLTDDLGAPVADDNYWIRFKLFDHPSAGTELWSTGSYVEVPVSGGIFSHLLGSTVPLPTDLAGNDSLWVEIKLDGSDPLTPRLRIVPVVWALRALTADTAEFAHNAAGGVDGWIDDGSTVRLETTGDDIGVGTTSPQAKLHVSTTDYDTWLNSPLGAVYGTHKSSGALAILGGDDYGVSAIGDAWGVKGTSDAGYGVHGYASTVGARGVYGSHINGPFGYLGGETAAVYGYNMGAGHSGFFEGKFYLSGNVGINTTTPQNMLDINGGMVVGGSYSGIKTAPANGALFEGRVGIGMTIPNHPLYIHQKVDGIAYPLKLDNSDWHPNSAVGVLFSVSGEGGGVIDTVRGKGALVYEYSGTWNRGNFHFLQNSDADSLNPDLTDAALTIKNNGNVGIGNANPDVKLDVNGNLEVTGDLVVTGAFRGSQGTDGAPFPRAAYDSGWIPMLPGSEATFTHNIGVDVNRYFVDLQFTNDAHGLGIHNYAFGGYGGNIGVFWRNLTTTTIKVYREEDDWLADQVRVRIWLIN